MPETMLQRSERIFPKSGTNVQIRCASGDGYELIGPCKDVSSSGVSLLAWSLPKKLRPGDTLEALDVRVADRTIPLGGGQVVRLRRTLVNEENLELFVLAVRFAAERPQVYEDLEGLFQSRRYVAGELQANYHRQLTSTVNAEDGTLADFRCDPSDDVLSKCHRFHEWVKDLQHKTLYQSIYRVTLTGPIDHRVFGFDPLLRKEREFLCFDSNSYLGLHLHPRVVGAAVDATRRMGPGTPSAQLLCGTNRHLRELERAIAEFHGRDDAMVFPTGFAANAGILAALVREDDVVTRDRFAHASLHEGCRGTRSRYNFTFPHNDFDALDSFLTDAEKRGCQGKLVATDGVFSMHGKLTHLPRLREVTSRHGGRLLIDDAHGTGVIGETGGGIEEYYGMHGAADILMGTLSKVLGCLGGYVCGSKELIYYLRFFAPSGMFTTTLPAPICAALVEGFRVLREEPEHRLRLWHNIRRLWQGLRDAGLLVCDPESAILTVFMGATGLMMRVSRDLFRAGIKCGNVMYPAVARGQAILRLTVSSRHTDADIDQAVDTIAQVAGRYGITHKTEEEVIAIGERVVR